MKTDFKSWERATLEKFARQVADEHLVLTKQIEAMAWRTISTLPVVDRIVLLFDGSIELSHQVWPGYLDNHDRWTYSDGHRATPTHWTPMLAGPVLHPVVLKPSVPVPDWSAA